MAYLTLEDVELERQEFKDDLPEFWHGRIDNLCDMALRTKEAERQRDAMQERYNELIMAVAKKHPDETRHQTALRYIQQRERASMQFSGVAKSALKGDGNG